VFEPRDLELCSRLNLWHAVHCDEQIDWLAAHKTQVPHRVFLKMNSGMNRLGFTPQRYRAAWARLNALPQVDEISLMTHFSDADGPRGIAHQMAAFNTATQDLPGERSLCNSAATLRHAADARVRADWVRAGIVLYGSAPDYPEHTTRHWGLQPTMTLATRIMARSSCRRATPWATARASRPRGRSPSAWPPAVMPTATRATATPARRCW
jgi:alanine racemase